MLVFRQRVRGSHCKKTLTLLSTAQLTGMMASSIKRLATGWTTEVQFTAVTSFTVESLPVHQYIYTNIRRAWLCKCAVRVMRKKVKLSSSGRKNWKWWRLSWGLAESAFCKNPESSGQFCVGAFGRNLASVAVKILPHFIYFMKNVINFILSIRFA
jgi:hypothetical protein